MNAPTGSAAMSRHPSPAEFAEAAAWMARLHGPNRNLQVERGFRRWLTADKAHAAAFEAMTATWEATGRMPQKPFPRISRWQRAGYREGFLRSAAAVAAVAVLGLAVLFLSRSDDAVATRVGEQRTLTLEDGTRVVLNTDTHLEVNYSEGERRVRLRNGEALFEVARHPGRPFVVAAGEREIQALGTVFVVRRDRDRVAVTLLEGKVAVGAGESSRESSSILSPGERLLLTRGAAPAIDRPPVDKVTAWRRGLVDFEDTVLSAAVQEMNRYSTSRLVIENPQTAQIRINGVFRTGDSASFAAAVARVYRLQVIEGHDEIRLAGPPAGAAAAPSR